MAIVEGISAAKAGFDLIRNALDLLKREQLDRHEVAARLLELQGLILETRQALADAQEENRELRTNLADLSVQQNLESSLLFLENVYWMRLAENSLDGPFCPTCWHKKDKRLVRLAFISEDTYLVAPSTPTGIRKRRYNCTLHPRDDDFLIRASIFDNVKIHWTPPAT